MHSVSSKIFFRVDANTKMGAGHLMRCISLAHAFKGLGYESHFLISHETQDLIHNLAAFKFEYHCIDTSFNAEQEFRSIIDSSKVDSENTNSCIIVLDGYQFNSDYRKSLKSLGFILVLLDDENNSDSLWCDVVLNPTEASKSLNYQTTAKDAIHLLGLNYALLRPEFQQYEKKSTVDNELFICFGASDVAGLTLPVLEVLLNSGKYFNQVSVVTGAAYPNPKLLAHKISNAARIRHYHNVSDMANLMGKAKVAISASGGTIFELLSLNIPSILVVVADNQLLAAKEHEALGWCKVIDARNGVDPAEIISLALELWSSPALLEKMRQKAAMMDIRHGSMRVAQAILSYRMRYEAKQCSVLNAYGISLRAVQYGDLERIRGWRNDPDIKEFMFDQSHISSGQQKAWFKTISTSLMQQHFLIEYKNQPIGVLNIKSLEQTPLGICKKIEPGLYIGDSRYRGNILAFCPSLAVLDYCFEVLGCEHIVARVLRSNPAAIKYNQAMGYSLPQKNKQCSADENEADSIAMQLNYEDYCAHRDKIKKILRIQ